jgi:site-specific recombinase XerD
VFTTSIGTPLDPRNVTRGFGEQIVRAGLPPMRLQDARHGAATLYLPEGEDIRTIGALLGHSWISVTERYAHVTKKLKAKAAARPQASLFSAKTG